MALSSDNKKLAVRRLCSSTDPTLKSLGADLEASPTQILKTRQLFSSNMTHSVVTGNLDAAAVYAECQALLSYLTADGATEPMSATQGNISAAMDSILSSSSEFETRGFEQALAHEQILQFAAKLLYHNACHG